MERMTDQEMWRYVVKNIGIAQYKEEMFWALDRARDYLGEPVQVVLEIGMSRGGSFCMWSQLLRDRGIMIGVDPQISPKFLKEEAVCEVLPTNRYYFIKRRSEDPETLREIKRILGRHMIDFVAIDSLHTYDQTKIEHEMCEPLMASPGMIFFHDIAGHHGRIQNIIEGLPDRTTGEYWMATKYGYSYEEKRANTHKGPMGTGLIFL